MNGLNDLAAFWRAISRVLTVGVLNIAALVLVLLLFPPSNGRDWTVAAIHVCMDIGLFCALGSYVVEQANGDYE